MTKKIKPQQKPLYLVWKGAKDEYSEGYFLAYNNGKNAASKTKDGCIIKLNLESLKNIQKLIIL